MHPQRNPLSSPGPFCRPLGCHGGRRGRRGRSRARQDRRRRRGHTRRSRSTKRSRGVLSAARQSKGQCTLMTTQRIKETPLAVTNDIQEGQREHALPATPAPTRARTGALARRAILLMIVVYIAYFTSPNLLPLSIPSRTSKPGWHRRVLQGCGLHAQATEAFLNHPSGSRSAVSRHRVWPPSATRARICREPLTLWPKLPPPQRW